MPGVRPPDCSTPVLLQKGSVHMGQWGFFSCKKCSSHDGLPSLWREPPAIRVLCLQHCCVWLQTLSESPLHMPAWTTWTAAAEPQKTKMMMMMKET